MPTTAIVCGLLLIVTGLAGYFLADAGDRSVTALIPTVFGILLQILGIGSQVMPNARKHLMHAAAAVGLLGAILAGGRLAMVLVKGGGSTLGLASLGAMTAICVVFVILCVQSFRAARRNSP